MRRLLLPALVLVAAMMLQAVGQRPDRPAQLPVIAPPPPTVVDDVGYVDSGGSTPASAAMQGMSSLVRAQGDANLANSAAAINMEEARRQNIENQKTFTDTYFQMRQMNRTARAAERGPRLSEEQLVRIAQAGAPKRLFRAGAAKALGTLGPLAKESLPALQEAARDESPAVQEAARDAIKAISG